MGVYMITAGKKIRIIHNKIKSLDKSEFENEEGFYKTLAILQSQELIALKIGERGLNRKKSSKEMGKNSNYLYQTLSDGRNLTVGTLSVVLYNLGYKLNFHCESIIKDPEQEVLIDGIIK